MSDTDETGIAFLIGLQHGMRSNDAAFAEERARLRSKLPSMEAEVDAALLSEKAKQQAIGMCIAATVDELAAKAAGKPIKPRHSDPFQGAQQAEDFVDTAEANLKRLSSGTLSFSEDSVESAKRSQLSLLSASKRLKVTKVK